MKSKKEKSTQAIEKSQKISQALEKSKKIHGSTPGSIVQEDHDSPTSIITQDQIQASAPISVAYKRFSLELPHGPYSTVNFTCNGRHTLIAGSKGHVAAFDWKTGKLSTELNLQERVNHAHWLHNELLFAVAQRKHLFIYDHNGLEVHCLKAHTEIQRLEFLKWHFLLVSSGKRGMLRWQDVSTGTLIAETKTGLGVHSGKAMSQNSQNAIIHLGHSGGQVSLWSPTMPKALVRVLCHRGPVQGIAVNRTGQYMATIGLDSKCKLWDMRNAYQPLYRAEESAGNYPFYNARPASSVAFSQTDLLAVATGSRISIWKEPFSLTPSQDSTGKGAIVVMPYLTHNHTGHLIEHLEFCPFEDVLAVGSNRGVSSLLVPGAGEANFDSLHFNPFQTRRQRQEAEVKGLLEKLQPETIVLEQGYFGQVELEK
jgi:U3 small nucleolar RNA-associated protein 7